MDYSTYNWDNISDNMQIMSNNPDELFFEADKIIKDGKITEAKMLLEKAIELDPKHGRSQNHLGWLCETKFKDYAKAEEYYKQALENAPEYTAPWMNYAYLLSTMKRFEDLEAHLNEATKVPGIAQSRIHAERGYMYEVQGKFTEAVEEIKQALLQSYSNDDLEQYQKDIERIKTKKEISETV